MKKFLRNVVLTGIALCMSVTSAVSPAGVVYAAESSYESVNLEESFEVSDDSDAAIENFTEENDEEDCIEVIEEEPESEELKDPEYEIGEYEDQEPEELELTEDSALGSSSEEITLEEEEKEEADTADFSEDASNKCGENATWSFNSSTGALVISGKGAMYDYSEENPAPWFGQKVKSLVVSEGITRIGNYAFFKASDLDNPMKSISLPNTLKSIGEYAFLSTKFAREVERFAVPDSVTELGKGAFSYFQLYRASTMSDTEIGGTFVLGKGIKVIPEECFVGAVALELELPEGLERVEDKGLYFFQGCKRFTFPKSLKYMGEKAFGYEWLYSYVNTIITFKGDMPKFGKDCFIRRCGIIYYSAGNSTYTEAARAAVQELTNYGFTWRSDAYVPSGKAGKDITWKTYNITEGKYTYKILELNGSGPMYDYSLTNLPDWFPERQSVDRIIFDSRITSIGDYAFYSFGNVNNVNYKNFPMILPSNLDKIGDYAFYSVYAPLVRLPDTVKHIGKYSCKGFKEATVKQFPKGVEYIGEYAFEYSDLEITVNWDKIEFIGQRAFSNAKKMTFSTVFPDTLRTIECGAFANTDGMKGQLSLSSATRIENGAFMGCKGVTGKVELPSITAIGVGAFGGTGITEIVLGENLSEIVDKSTGYNYLGEDFKSITFKNQYFYKVADFLSYLSYPKRNVTLYYPAGKGWPYEYFSRWEKIKFIPFGKHNITFVYPDESEHVMQVAVGEKFTAPTVSGLEDGVKIIGWFTQRAPEKDAEWDFDKVPDHDITLYALTNQVECVVKYWIPYDVEQMYDGSSTYNSSRVNYGECATYRRFSKQGARLTGWFLDKECTKPYDFSTPVVYNISLFSSWEKAEIFDLSTATDNISYEKEMNFVYDRAFHYFIPKISVNFGKGFEVLEKGVDYTLEYDENCKNGYVTNVGDYKVTVKGKGNFTGELTIYAHVTQLDISTAENIRHIDDSTCEYDGNEHKHLKDVYIDLEDGYRYIDNDDLKYEYVTNGSNRPFVDVGTYTVRITGINNCKGTIEYKQIIEPKSVDSYINFHRTREVTYEYNKKLQKFKPDPMLWDGKQYVPLKEGTDYTVEYVEEKEAGAYKEPGEYHIVVTGIGNYKDSYTIVEKITDSKSISKATVSGVKNIAFNGKYNRMTGIVVKYKGKILTEGEHYRVWYGNSINAGTGILYIDGIEAGGFHGRKKVTFKIAPHKITKADVNITGLSGEKLFNGSPILADNIKVSCDLPDYRSELVGCELSEYKENYPYGGGDYDYTYEYKKNVDAGTATLEIRGIRNFTGTIKKTFRIKAAAFNEEAVSEGRITVELPKTVAYTKGKTTLEPVVYYYPEDGSKALLLEKGKDYSLTYTNNTKVNDGLGKKAPTVKIKGIKNFKGTITRTFAITPSSINVCEITVNSVKYSKKANNFKASIVIRDTNGSKLAEGKDYEVRYYDASTGKELTSKDKAAIGDRIKVEIIGLGNYISESTLIRYYTIVK